MADTQVDRPPLRRAQPGLGTLVEIAIGAADRATELRASSAAFAAIAMVHRLMSAHDPDSDLGRINRAPVGASLAMDGHTARVLACALTLADESGGAFDCAVGSTLQHLGLLPAIAAPSVGAAGEGPAIALEGTTVRKLAPVSLDLGGIAKGYAVDLALADALAEGAHHVLINAGGDMRHHGEAPAEILLRDPRNPALAWARFMLHNRALASSRSGGLGDETQPSALINARHGASLPHGIAASIAAPSCMLADALTKVVLVSGDPHHPMLARHHAQLIGYLLH